MPRPITRQSHPNVKQGGKAAGILALLEVGARVPDSVGFDLEEIQRWLKNIPGYAECIEEWARWSERSAGCLEDFRQRLMASNSPAGWDEICSVIQQKLPSSCIVRSSMSVEDSRMASFAGAFESIVLERWDPQSLWKAAARALGSAFTESAVRRVLESELSPRGFQPGILIQQWIEPKLAGVCFSRDPARIWEKKGYVEWVSGRGEELVQGTRTPKSARQDTQAPEGLEAIWERLWSVAELCEKKLGAPADLEWVFDGRELWFVQLRPVTADEVRVFQGRWSRELSQERFPEVISPIGWTAISDALPFNVSALSKYFGIYPDPTREMAVSVRGVVYSDPEFFKFPGRVKIAWWRYLNPLTAVPWKLAAALARFAMRRGKGSRELLSLEVTLTLLESSALRIQSHWSAHVEEHMGEISRFSDSLAPRLEDPASVLQAMEELREISLRFLEPDLAIFLIKDSLRKTLEALWRGLDLSQREFSELINYFEGNRTLMLSEQWSGLVEAVKSDSGAQGFVDGLRVRKERPEAVLGGKSRERWLEFLKRNGHCRTNWDLAVASWGEDPRQLLSWLEASLQQTPLSPGKSSEQRSKLSAESREKFSAALSVAGFSSRQRRVNEAIQMILAFMSMDEELHFLTGRLLEPSRALVLAAGRLLAQTGILSDADDAFYLELRELKAALRSPDTYRGLLAQRRREQWKRSSIESAPMHYPPEESVPFPARSSSGWTGQPVSSGTAEGVVCHVEQWGEHSPPPRGAILVTRSPNPAYVPLYPILGGIISESGGLLSHGFVAAREFGIPAVSGITGAVEALRPGTRVRIDGHRGTIEIL